MTVPEQLEIGLTVEVVVRGEEDSPWEAQVASVLDAGVVLTRPSGHNVPDLDTGMQVKLIATIDGQAKETQGSVAGSSPAGVAIELKDPWRPVERRGFPRSVACIPMRYQVIDEATEKRVAIAIQSRITDRNPLRKNETFSDQKELSILYGRLQKIERSLELLTDLVLWAGTSQAPLSEHEIVLSANGFSFEPETPLDHGTMLEIEMLLPLPDPIRVRATGRVVQTTEDGDKSGRVAVRFQCIDESDQDEIGRYVFQLQRVRSL